MKLGTKVRSARMQWDDVEDDLEDEDVEMYYIKTRLWGNLSEG